MCSFSPVEKEEVQLIDKFIETYASVYQLPEPVFSELLEKILSNRINNAAWQYDKASKQHLMRILQCIRILTREPTLSQIFLQESGLQYLCGKLHEISISTKPKQF